MNFRDHLNEPIICPKCGHENMSVAERLEKNLDGDPYICSSSTCGAYNEEAKNKGKDAFVDEAINELSTDPEQEKLNKKFADIEAAHKLMREAPSDGGWAYIIGLVVIFFIFWMILE